MYYRPGWAQTLDQTAKMLQRLDNTKWLWCLLALHVGSFWGTARSVTMRAPPNNPSTIEAQAKFFQDFFSVQLSPYKIEFGHVCEDPNTWEQRYEKKDFKNHRDMGKVRWGDKKGGYGEHYWDLNHAGNAGNHGDDSYDGDDGSYHESIKNDPYEGSRDSSPNYGDDEYDPEKSSYEENGRAKRAYSKTKVERKLKKSSDKENEDEEPKPKKKTRKNREYEPEPIETSQEEDYEDDPEEEPYEKPKSKRQHHRKLSEDKPQPKEKNQVVLVVSHKDDTEKEQSQYATKKTSQTNQDSRDTATQYSPQKQHELPQYLPQKQVESSQYLPQTQPEYSQYLPQKQPELQQYVPKQHLEPPQYVPYEGGAGVRQHQQPEVSAATTVPRLFLEPTTGHVVDRATGQAYVLQPIAARNKYN